MKTAKILAILVLAMGPVVWSGQATGPGSLVGWGRNDEGQINVPHGNDFVAIAAGNAYSLALKSDGSIVGWGNNEHGQAIPPGGTDFVAIAAGGAIGVSHCLALKSDGSIVGWGYNANGQATPPDDTDFFVAIAAGGYHSLALKSDGSIVGWGRNESGQAFSPLGTDFVDIAAAAWGGHNLALKSDGSIVGWGNNEYDQAIPPGGTNFVAIAAAGYYSLALKTNGSIVRWGRDDLGQATPPEGNDFVAIAAGFKHGLALKSDGSIVCWGDNTFGQATAPDGNNFVAIAAGGSHSLAIKAAPSGGPDNDWIVSGDNMYSIPTGNVGIGTESPSEKLDVAGALNLNEGIYTGVALRVNRAEALWYNGDYFSWGFGGTANFFADSVGIGTTSPDARLDVVSDTSPAILLRGPSSGTGTIGFYKGSDWMGQMGYGDVCGSGLPGLDEALGICSYTGTATIGTSGRTTLIVKDTGNVGIGTTRPDEKLQVAGNVKVSGAGNGVIFPDGTKQTTAGGGGGGADSDWTISGNNMYSGVSGNVGIGTTSPDARLHVVSDTSPAILLRGPRFGEGTIGFYKGSDWMGQMGYGDVCGSGLPGLDEALGICSYTGTTTIGTSGRTTLIVKDTGRVGIGITTPARELDVNGKVRIHSFYAGGSTYDLRVQTDGDLVAASSSKRYKEDIKDLEVGPDGVCGLRPVSFRWKESGEQDIGLIAEEVAGLIKDLVVYDQEGRPDAVKYDKVALYLLAVVKTQQQKIAALEQRVEALERAILANQSGQTKEVNKY